MRKRSLFDQPAVPRLSVLMEQVRAGEIQIPRFQRPFVWDDERRLTLLESVYQGMPIGSFMVWRTETHRLEVFKNLGPFRINLERLNTPPRSYLVDGFQRLTTLYGALNPTDDGVEVPSEDRIRWPIYFDLQDTGDRPFKFLPRNRIAPVTWLPLSSLLDPKRLYDHQKKLLAADQPQLSSRAESLAIIFKDYQIPIIPLVSEDLNTVTTAFMRINSQGKKMSDVHMLAALTYTQDFDLKERIKAIREQVRPLGWEDVPDSALTGALKARWNLDIYEADSLALQAHLSWERDGLDGAQGQVSALDALPAQLTSAANFLADRCLILGPYSLPYVYQLVALMEVARCHPEPWSDATQAALERWFWHTTYAESFTGAASHQLAVLIQQAVSAVQGTEDKPAEGAMGEAPEVGPVPLFNLRAVRTQASILAHLHTRPNPEDRRSGAQVLAELGAQAFGSLSPDLPASTFGNRLLVHPRSSREERQAILDPSHPEHESTLGRHAIPPEAAAALIAGDPATCVALRAQELWRQERGFIASRGLRVGPP